MANNNYSDITQTGKQTGAELQKENEKTFNKNISLKEFMEESSKNGKINIFNRDAHFRNEISNALPEDVQSPMLQSSIAQGNLDNYWGKSRYDEEVTNDYGWDFQTLNDTRSENQPWYSQLANGIAKGVVLAGTTFLDGTLGLVVGIGTAIGEGRFSGIWDNDFSKAMQSANDWAEREMPNYYTIKQQEDPWSAENMFSANFLGDKLLKNIGFMVGAYYSGAAWTKALNVGSLATKIGASSMSDAVKGLEAARATGSAEKIAEATARIAKASRMPATITSAFGATVSAVNEGRIEALNNSRDWFNVQKQAIDDDYMNQLANAYNEYQNTPQQLVQEIGPDGKIRYVNKTSKDYDDKLNAIERAHQDALTRLEEDRFKMGNADFLMNLPILTASNIIMYAKLYSGGFKTARQLRGVTNKGKYAGMTLDDAIKAGTKEGKSIAEIAKDYAQFSSKELSRTQKILRTFKDPLSEGTEELSQRIASDISGFKYESDVQNFYKAKLNDEAADETISWMEAIQKAVVENVGSGQAWEEFFIGALSSTLGMPTFGKKANSSSSTYLGRGKMIGLSGGIIGDIRSNKEEGTREKAIIDQLNRKVQSPEFIAYLQGLSRNKVYEKGMEAAAEANDEFEYKNNEFAQLVSTAAMFDNVGRISDLYTLLDLAYDTSKENLESIVKNTSKIVESEGGKKVVTGKFSEFASIDKDGNIVANFGNDEQYQKAAKMLTDEKNKLSKQIQDYVLTKNEIDVTTGQQLSDDQLEELTWIKSQINDWKARGGAIASDIKPTLRTLQQLFNRLEEYARDAANKNRNDAEAYYKNKDKEKSYKLSKNVMSMLAGLDSSETSDEELFSRIASDPALIDDVVKILSDPKLLENIQTVYGIESAESIPEVSKIRMMDETERVQAINKLKDIKRISSAIGSFNTKLVEYLNNPEAQKKDQAKATEEVAAEVTDKKFAEIAKRFNWKGKVSDLAKSIADNEEELNKLGGVEAFKKALPKELQDKLDKAIAYRKGTKSMREVIDKSDLTDEEKRYASAILDKVEGEAADINELRKLILEDLNQGWLNRKIVEDSANMGDAGVNDLNVASKVENMEVKLKELFDNNLTKIAEDLDKLEETKAEDLKKAGDAFTKADEESKKAYMKGKVPEEHTPGEKDSPEDNNDVGPGTNQVPKDVKEDIGEVGFNEGVGNPLITKEGFKQQHKNANRSDALTVEQGTSDPEFNTRPQLSLYPISMRNYGTMTYAEALEQGKIPYPKGITDKAAYLKYVKAVTDYMVKHKAFDYISGLTKDFKLEANDEITFKVDPELNRAAGTQVVLIVTNKDGREQVIGSLPSALDFNIEIGGKKVSEIRSGQKALYDEVLRREALDKSPVLVNASITHEGHSAIKESEEYSLIHDYRHEIYNKEGTPYNLNDADRLLNNTGYVIRRNGRTAFYFPTPGRGGDNVTVSINKQLTPEQEEALIKKLYPIWFSESSNTEKIAETKKAYNEVVDNGSITTKVNALRAGRILFGDAENSLETVFNGEAPYIAINDETKGRLVTGDDNVDKNIVQLKGSVLTATPWQIYALVPTNNGKYLPALCYSTKLSDVLRATGNEWYVNEIVKAFNTFSKGNITDARENSSKIFKLIPVRGLAVQMGHMEGNKFVIETADTSKVTHIRVAFNDPSDTENTSKKQTRILALDSDRGVSASSIVGVLRYITSKDMYPDMTTNVDLTRLSDPEYRKNISRYLHTNIVSSEGHSVNDFFTYEPTDIEKKNASDIEVDTAAEDKKAEVKESIQKGGSDPVIGEEIEVDEKTYVQSDGLIYDENGRVVTDGATEQKVQEEAEKGKQVEEAPKRKQGTSFFGFSKSSDDDISDLIDIAERNRDRGESFEEEDEEDEDTKNMLVSATDDKATTEIIRAHNIAKLKQLFPELSDTDRIVIVNGLINTVDSQGNPVQAYGQFRDGVLYISNMSPAGTAYHEAFHYVVDTLLTENDMSLMMKDAAEKYGKLSDLELEEKLAEDFRLFMNNYDDKSITGRIKSFFRNLKRIINNIFGNINYIDNVFYSIYRGKYANRDMSKVNTPDSFKSDLKRYKAEQLSYDKLDSETKEILSERGISKEEFDELPVENKEDMLFCLI